MNRVFLLFALFISSVSLAQFSPVRRAMDNLADGDLLRAKELLVKAFEKDSLDPAIKYGLSVLFNDSSYPGASIDSSYYYILSARRNYDQLDEKAIDKMIKSGVNPAMLEEQKKNLDRQAFIASEELNTVDGYREYQSKFPSSRFIDNSRELERKVAFENTQALDTHESYMSYMDRYPNSKYYSLALERFELLYFRDLTSSRKLNDYLNFLEKRPSSPYRVNAESEILEILTAGNRVIDFRKFFEVSEVPSVRKKASDILYHVLKQDESLNLMEPSWFTDSLKFLTTASDHLYPFVDKEGYYFIDDKGVKKEGSYYSISKDYLCQPPGGDVLIVKNTVDLIIQSLTAKTEVFRGPADSAIDLGYGIIKLTKDQKSGILLKNGVQVSPFIYDDIRLIGNSFIAIKSSGLWGIVSFLGRSILPVEYESIEYVNGSVLLKKDEKIAVSSINTIRKAADGENINLVFIYDEWEEWPSQKLWVRSGSSEGIINRESSFDIELADQEIIQESDSYLIYGSTNTLLDSDFNVVSESWNEIKISEGFIALQFENESFLINRINYSPTPYDTLFLWGNEFATSAKQGINSLHFQSGKLISIPNTANFSWIHDGDVEYLLLKGEKENTLYNSNGKIIITSEHSNFKALGPEYLILQDGQEEFLYTSGGDLILEEPYDAFGTYENGGISVLKNGKLGYFNLEDSIWIPPSYSGRITNTGNGWYIVTEGSTMQLINANEEPVLQESFDDIILWSDSSFLVKKDGLYFTFFPGKKSFSSSKYREVKPHYFGSDYLLVQDMEGDYGILSPSLETLIGTGYSFIEPYGKFWRAEKYFKESDYYIVALYSKDGTLLFRTGLTPEEYDKIICESSDE